MVGGAAGDEVDAVDGSQLLLGHLELVQLDALLSKAAGEQALDGLGLLGDLLGHEVGVAAQGCRGGVPVDVDGRGLGHGQALGVKDLHLAILGEVAELAVLELDDVGCHAGKRRDVGGAVGAVGRRGHHERAAVAGDHDLPGDVGADRGDGPGALQAAAGVAHGGQQVSLGGTGPGVLDEVGDDL